MSQGVIMDKINNDFYFYPFKRTLKLNYVNQVMKVNYHISSDAKLFFN